MDCPICGSDTLDAQGKCSVCETSANAEITHTESSPPDVNTIEANDNYITYEPDVGEITLDKKSAVANKEDIPVTVAAIDPLIGREEVASPEPTPSPTRRGSRPLKTEGDPSATNPSTSRFCGRCGSAVGKDDEFCGICGNPLTESSLQKLRTHKQSRPMIQYDDNTARYAATNQISIRTNELRLTDNPSSGLTTIQWLGIICLIGALISAGFSIYFFILLYAF
jgi:hypothetical protein